MNYPLDMLDLKHTIAEKFISECSYVWQVFEKLKENIFESGKSLNGDFTQISENVWVHKAARISPSAHIGEYTIIGEGTEVRNSAYIRGSALIGSGCVVGNSTEIKNSILFDGVQVPHFNYIGDSILGYRAHLGAGAITSNVKSDKSPVLVKNGENVLYIGGKKLGAIVCDFAEIGCNSVLNPGCVIGKNVSVYPLSCVRGCISPDTIYKSSGVIVSKK